MMKKALELWDKNQEELKKAIDKIPREKYDDLTYLDLVRLTFKHIFELETGELARITEIDNGHYQGTLFYVIPLRFDPSPDEYFTTYSYYGSCSGCDALQGLTYELEINRIDLEQAQKDLLELCRDLAENTVCPYNYGWCYKSEYDRVAY